MIIAWKGPIRGLHFVIARSDALAIRGPLLRIQSELRRGEYFAGLFILSLASGLTPRIIESVRIGWEHAVINTFEISAIIWIACIAGVSLVFRERTPGIGHLDLAVRSRESFSWSFCRSDL